MINIKLKCPDCDGFLRILSNKELIQKFPSSRAADCAKDPSMLHDHLVMLPNGYVKTIYAKPRRIGVYCDKCGHFHDMDERGLRNQIKTKAADIKHYGTYHW